MLDSIYESLVDLPPVLLYVAVSAAAVAENFFPPFPSDIVIAFGSFLLAQGGAGKLALLAAGTWAGNVAGAMLVYALGRKYGAERLEKHLAGKHAESWDRRFHAMFDRYGLIAIFVSRFVPGVRAVVPVVAGAVRTSAFRTFVLIGAASAIWYGGLTYIAYRVGRNWEALQAAVSRYGTLAGIAGAAILVLAIGIWMLLRKRPQRD